MLDNSDFVLDLRLRDCFLDCEKSCSPFISCKLSTNSQSMNIGRLHNAKEAPNSLRHHTPEEVIPDLSPSFNSSVSAFRVSCPIRSRMSFAKSGLS